MTIGPSPGMDPESFKHSKYIILWACNTISTNLHHWPFIAEAKNKGAKLVVIDPVKTRTAREADWHIPIRPGHRRGAGAGMMNVIISEDLVDRDYVEKYTTGFDELKERVRAYTPELVAEITGIPAARHQDAGAGIRDHPAERDPHRRRDRAPCRRRPDRARCRVPAGTRRCVAPCWRRHACSCRSGPSRSNGKT